MIPETRVGAGDYYIITLKVARTSAVRTAPLHYTRDELISDWQDVNHTFPLYTSFPPTCHGMSRHTLSV